MAARVKSEGVGRTSVPLKSSAELTATAKYIAGHPHIKPLLIEAAKYVAELKREVRAKGGSFIEEVGRHAIRGPVGVGIKSHNYASGVGYNLGGYHKADVESLVDAIYSHFCK